MRVQIQISDDVYDLYLSYATRLSGKVAVEDILRAQLEQFAKVCPTDRIIVVDARNRASLEQLLPSGGSLRDAADLVDRVDRLARIDVGEVRVPFTPPELAELALRARRQNRPIQRLVEEAVASFHERYFNWADSRPCVECAARKQAEQAPQPPAAITQAPAPVPAPTSPSQPLFQSLPERRRPGRPRKVEPAVQPPASSEPESKSA